MKLVSKTIVLMTLSLGYQIQAEECTKAQAKDAVKNACNLISKNGKDALNEIRKFRYCGTNYVWIQDSNIVMVMHPIKPRLNKKPLNKHKDEKGTHLFVEFDKTAKTNEDGGWVDYLWAKPGAEKATAKTSFVQKCPGELQWIAGSGIWK